MKNILRVTILSTFLFLFSCASSVKVKYDYDKTQKFSGIQTYDFLETPDIQQLREYTVSAIKKSLESNLNEKNLTRSLDNPDILVAFHVQVTEQMTIANWGYVYSPGHLYWQGSGYWWGGAIDTRYFGKGSLIVDFVDAERKNLIWRGVAESILPEHPAIEQINKLVNKAVSKIMEKYPPPDSGKPE